MLPVRYRKDLLPYWVTFGGSVIFSIVAIICEPYLNNDGIFYIDAANVYLEEGISNASKSYAWPFYSILIALFHQITGLPLHGAAHLINTILISLTCLLFIKLYAIVTHHRGNLWVACILVLTLSGINKFRDDVMRDFGYWCFVLTGLLFLFKYFAKPTTSRAIAWQLAMALAFMFRIEAVALMILGPLGLFLKNLNQKKFYHFTRLYSLYFIIVLVGCVVLVVLPDSFELSSTRLKDLPKYGNISGLADGIAEGVGKMGALFWYDGLNIEKNFATLLMALIASMMAYCLTNIVACISIPIAIVTIYGFARHSLEFNQKNGVVLYLVLTQFLVLFVFLSQMFLLVPRYATILAFLLLLFTGQILENVVEEFGWTKKVKAVFIALLVALAVQTGDTLITFGGYSKNHIVRAGLWAEDHIPPSLPLISSDLKAVYYAGRKKLLKSEVETETILAKIESFQFPAGTHIIIDGKVEQRDHLLGIMERYAKDGLVKRLKTFENKEGDWAIVIRIEAVVDSPALKPAG